MVEEVEVVAVEAALALTVLARRFGGVLPQQVGRLGRALAHRAEALLDRRALLRRRAAARQRVEDATPHRRVLPAVRLEEGEDGGEVAVKWWWWWWWLWRWQGGALTAARAWIADSNVTYATVVPSGPSKSSDSPTASWVSTSAWRTRKIISDWTRSLICLLSESFERFCLITRAAVSLIAKVFDLIFCAWVTRVGTAVYLREGGGAG